MAKITAKADLVRGTNYKFNLVDVQGTDISVNATLNQIASTTTNFTATSETSGVVKRPIAVGDKLKLSNMGNATNEGLEVVVDTVAANLIDYTPVSTPPVTEAAGAAVNLTAFKKTYQFLATGGLSFVDGVAAITWASEIVDEWDTGNLDIYDKIYTSIEPRAKSLASLNGWEPHDSNTLLALRDMALEIKDTPTSAARRTYACLRSGNLHGVTDQFAFWPPTDAAMTAPTAAVTQGFINQLVLIRDTDNAIDRRGNWQYRCLEPGKTHLQGAVDLQYAEIYPVPSNNAIDPKLANPGTGVQFVSDATVGAGGIYANIDVNVDVDQLYSGDVDGTLRSFQGFVDGDSKENETVHTKLHYLLRQPTNINVDGTGPQIRGDKAPAISSFSGDLITLQKYYLLNYNASQRNNLNLVDVGGVTRSWPSAYVVTIAAPSVAIGGTFSIIHTDTFGSSGPTYLISDAAVAQQDRTIAASVQIVVAFSTYNNGGHTPNTPIPLILTYNRPGFIEPDNIEFTLSAANITVAISPTADPSYSAS
jgi:hypothetical protein